MEGTKVVYPMLDIGIVELARLSIKLVVGIRYLEDVRDGRKPLRPKFRAKAARILRKTEAELFGPEAGE